MRKPTKDKPEHYGISNDCDVREIHWALRTFVDRVRGEDEIPEHLLHFIADGVERYLKNEQPWSKKRDKKIDNQGKVTLIRFILDNGGERHDIAAHLNISTARVSQLLKDNPNPLHKDFHLAMWSRVFKGKSVADMLNLLSKDYG
ncbi:hypothetical protein AB4302_02850 [Vibrio breoganii]|uniref:hypothetical protein n=1 Tax=Vibrio breoganii TaxID=553239 RepID=UPI000C82835D|nr:hypothetical protein [Vibrio breoganii]PMP04565.1 hypothetical protein BCS95_05455 [Vibrio breoganii]PMP08913.1 hypothetical protein BCS94_06865 [Vibrio breoganii]